LKVCIKATKHVLDAPGLKVCIKATKHVLDAPGLKVCIKATKHVLDAPGLKVCIKATPRSAQSLTQAYFLTIALAILNDCESIHDSTA